MQVEKGAIVGGGSMVPPGTTVPSGQIWAGIPAKFLRNVTEEEASFLEQAAMHMHTVAIPHAIENAKTFEEVTHVPGLLVKVLRPAGFASFPECDALPGKIGLFPAWRFAAADS